MDTQASKPLWVPPESVRGKLRIHKFIACVEQATGQSFNDYHDLWQWSVNDIETFWSLLWDFSGVIGNKGNTVLVDGHKMPGAQWFPEASLNYAENLLQHTKINHTDVENSNKTREAMVFWGEDKVKRRLSWQDLQQQVSQCQQALKQAGVGKGDRVAGFLPNMPEAIIAMLATASLGAVWSSASPDFGVEGVLDRFGQIAPKVLFCVDGYYYNNKIIDCTEKNEEVINRMPDLTVAVYVSYIEKEVGFSDKTQSWQSLLEAHESRTIEYEQVTFNHPLFIMFSSGTTGKPKCIVHSVGGTLLQHLKEHQLHSDVREGDRLFYFTTCGWMMWNWLVTGLASGASLLLYDGSPFAGDKAIVFDFAETESMTQLGTSAKYLEAANKFGLEPVKTHRLSTLRTIFSTGSPLAPESYDFVYERVKPDVQLASISGGTDIISCFALGCPILPVWRGELQCRGLGMSVDVFDDNGQSMMDESGVTGKGELVCTRPFPSMPVSFWNDEDGSRYHAAYFDRFETVGVTDVWCHGDFVELTRHQGMIIHGRSDAVLNPGGVRIGTAEIYRQVEKIPEVMESIVIGQQWQGDVRVVLFVRLRDELALDEELVNTIKAQIRQKTTPRHVPAKVVQVADIPRTRSGKITELAVRDVVHGREVKNKESLLNPEALELFRDIEELGMD